MCLFTFSSGPGKTILIRQGRLTLWGWPKVICGQLETEKSKLYFGTAPAQAFDLLLQIAPSAFKLCSCLSTPCWRLSCQSQKMLISVFRLLGVSPSFDKQQCNVAARGGEERGSFRRCLSAVPPLWPRCAARLRFGLSEVGSLALIRLARWAAYATRAPPSCSWPGPRRPPAARRTLGSSCSSFLTYNAFTAAGQHTDPAAPHQAATFRSETIEIKIGLTSKRPAIVPHEPLKHPEGTNYFSKWTNGCQISCNCPPSIFKRSQSSLFAPIQKTYNGISGKLEYLFFCWFRTYPV